LGSFPVTIFKKDIKKNNIVPETKNPGKNFTGADVF